MIAPSNIFGCVLQHLLGKNARDVDTPSSWPTAEETAYNFAVGHYTGVAQTFTIEQMYQGKGLRAGGVYLIL